HFKCTPAHLRRQTQRRRLLSSRWQPARFPKRTGGRKSVLSNLSPRPAERRDRAVVTGNRQDHLRLLSTRHIPAALRLHTPRSQVEGKDAGRNRFSRQRKAAPLRVGL